MQKVEHTFHPKPHAQRHQNCILNRCLFINKAIPFLLLLMVSIHTYDFFTRVEVL